MHFSKTYSQLLLSLPQELQDNAIEYRQLKKLINKVVLELSSLGLSPSVLHSLLQPNDAGNPSKEKGKRRAFGERPGDSSNDSEDVTEDELGSRGERSRRPPSAKAIYEIVRDGEYLEPRLRLWVGSAKDLVDDDPPPSPGSDSRMAIFLDKPESKPSSPVVEGNFRETLDNEKEDLLLVSKPITVQPGKNLIWSLQKRPRTEQDDVWKSLGNGNESEESLSAHPVELVNKHVHASVDGSRELIIPLTYDTAFFQLLQTALQSLAAHLLVVRSNFITNLEILARAISRTARPKSSTTRGYQPYSSSGDARSIHAPLLSPFSSSFVPGGRSKSDLYAWREIFQLYVESEVFESMSERNRGERTILETETRLSLFAERVTGRGLNDTRKLKLKESRDALETFLELNILILNLKKFQFANAEAARKILKKHAKRTALPFPTPRLDVSPSALPSNAQIMALFAQSAGPAISSSDILALIPTTATSLPHILVQAVGETLLPIIPHIDDYACLICTSIAFKPIRLACGHLFCVRCLVKMQKRGQDQCPCCRAPTVLKADRTNVDWALLNFMQDWFPAESAIKLKQNEKEAAQEELEELGISEQQCIVM